MEMEAEHPPEPEPEMIRTEDLDESRLEELHELFHELHVMSSVGSQSYDLERVQFIRRSISGIVGQRLQGMNKSIKDC